MLVNSYFSLAFNDLKYLKADMRDEEGAYNRQVVDAHMITERLLKGVLEDVELNDNRYKSDLLRSHNLRKIGHVLNEKLGTGLDLPNLSSLKDFYFEARYPGDNFIVVDKEMRDTCMDIMESVLEKLKPFIPSNIWDKSQYLTKSINVFDVD